MGNLLKFKVFDTDLEIRRKKLISKLSFGRKRYLTSAFILIFLFLVFAYYGPSENLRQFGLLAAKKLGQLVGAQQYAAVEAELATVSGPLTVGSDSTASSGKFIEFGSASANFQPTAPFYATFYYEWYKNQAIDGSYSYWQDHGNSPPNTWFSHYLPDSNTSAFDPASELYSSNDYNNFKWQVSKMAEAKQEVAIASWFGPSTKEDVAFNNIINSFMGRVDNPYPNLRWSMYYENEGFSDPSVATLVSDLTYIKGKYASSPYFLKIGGKPVIFVYADAGDIPGTMTQRWKDANTQMGNSFYVVLKVFPNFATDPNQPDSWHQYAPAARFGQHGSSSFFVSPGFWLDDGSAERLARNPIEFETVVKSMVSASATWKLVETWNEWGEGTSVEPGEQVKTVSGKDEVDPAGYQFKNLYIDILNRNLPSLEQGTGGSPGPTPTPSPIPSPLPTPTPTPSPIPSPSPTPSPSPAPDTTAPSAPSALAGTVISSGQVNLSWGASTDNVGVAKYNVVRNGFVVASVNAPTVTYSDKTVLPSTSYTYIVTAVDQALNESLPSNQVIVSTPAVADTTAPSAPTNLNATIVSTSQVNLAWGASGDNVGVAGYKVFRNNSQIATVVSGTSYGDGTVSAGNTYSYYVTAYDAAGNVSAASNTINVSVTAPSPSPSPSPSASPSPVAVGPCGTLTSPPTTYKHVIWLFMENKTYSQVIGNAAYPYQTQLANQCGTATKWSDAGSQYNSLSNYINATAAVDSCTSGCPATTWNDCNPSASCTAPIENIFRQVRAAGKTEKSYQESMTSNCQQSGGSNLGNYAPKHNPAAYFTGASDRAACLLNDVPMGTNTAGNLINDIKNNTLPDFALVTPNLCNDAHDCSGAVPDNFLKTLMPQIFASAAYQSGNTAVIILYDEDTFIPNMVITPYTKQGTVSSATFSHASLLRSTEEMLGLPYLTGGNATYNSAASMRSAFNM